MVKLFDIIKAKVSSFGLGSGIKPVAPVQIPTLFVNDMTNISAAAGQTVRSPWQNSIYDGSKFAGGFGATQLYDADYWTLRARSSQLFQENLYARGLIRRLITNEINTGLSPEFIPDEDILGVEEDSLNDWSEMGENRFGLWGKNPQLCDWKQKSTFGDLQRQARMEAFIEGDVLVILRQSKITKLPMIQLVKGSRVRTPYGDKVKLIKSHTVKHGVEQNKLGRVVAYHIQQDDLTFKRIPAYGRLTGRKVSWLIFGNDKRLDDLRGQPLLSIVLQSLKEIDRYRDSTQRKAVINSILAMFIEKTENKIGSLPLTGGATRRGSADVTDSDGTTRTFNIQDHVPGMIIEELQQGEKPHLKGGEGTDINFGTFEESIIQGVAWANEIPPEILTLAFSNNYSASQAAINEFKIYLNKVWSDWGETFCTPIEIEWLLSEVLLQKIKAPGLLESWRDPQQYDIFGAWVSTEWYGSIKPSTDMLKQVKASKELIALGLSTHAREARTTTGTKFSKNIKRIKRENELMVKAITPLAEFKKKFGGDDKTGDAIEALEDATLELVEARENEV